MKSIIEQKSELLDYVIGMIEHKKNTGVKLTVTERITFDRYLKITAPPTMSEDPFIHDVLSTRICNKIEDYFFGKLGKRLKHLQVSDCPSFEDIMKHSPRGFGYKSQQHYLQTLKEFGR